jgi:pentatricopeptide repeat protein
MDADGAARGPFGATVAGAGDDMRGAEYLGGAMAEQAVDSKGTAASAADTNAGTNARVNGSSSATGAATPAVAAGVGAAGAALDDDSVALGVGAATGISDAALGVGSPAGIEEGVFHSASVGLSSVEGDGELKRHGSEGRASRTEVAAALASEAAAAYREGGGRELAALVAMWRRLRLSPVPLDACLTNSFMSAALRCGAPRLARALFYDATSPAGEAVVVRPRREVAIVRPETSVYNTLIKAHGVAGERAEAEAVLQRMRAEGVPPDVYTVNTLMSVCAKAADRQGMLRYFRALEEAGLAPTIDSWNVVLDFCSRAKQPGQAKDVLRRMRAAGIEPDAVSYACMIQAHVRSAKAAGGGVDAAARVLDEALGAKVKLDAPAFNALLGGYATQLRWADAIALLNSMRSHGVSPNHLSYSLVLRACVRARAADQAASLLEMMLADGLPATVRTFSMVLSAYAHGGQVRLWHGPPANPASSLSLRSL